MPTLETGGLFRGRPRFGIINTVSTWITPTRAVSVRYNNRSRPNGRDFCQRLIRKLAHTVPIDSVQRFYARLTVLSRAATGATDAAASSQNCIKILARYVEWARNLSRFDSVLFSWWNKLAVCRFLFSFFSLLGIGLEYYLKFLFLVLFGNAPFCEFFSIDYYYYYEFINKGILSFLVFLMKIFFPSSIFLKNS